MKKVAYEQKDFYLIAQKIKNQAAQANGREQTHSEFDKQSEEALKMIQAYRKVENLKPLSTNKLHQQPQSAKGPHSSIQPKSTYATKIKQTLRQLNANKAKEYEKLSQKSIQLKSQPQTLQVVNQQAFKAKSQQQNKLVVRAVQKIHLLIASLLKKTKKHSFTAIIKHSDSILDNEYLMVKKYRLFRLFTFWKEETKLLKIQNQRKRKQAIQKELSATQMANEFRIFTLSRKVLKQWAKTAKMEKKKRKYEHELRQVQSQRNSKRQFPNQPQRQPETESHNGQLQGKLKGFLNGLKQKIEHKQKPQLHPITEHSQQSQQASNVFSLPPQSQQARHQQDQHQPQTNLQNDIALNKGPKQPLSNEALQKNRQQIYQRSKQRKEALDKLKKQKQMQKRKDQEERKILEKQIQEENKRIKELKYKEFQLKKKLQKEWEEREIELTSRADQWNRLRLMKYHAFDHWKSLQSQNIQKASILVQAVEKTMIRHAGLQLFENLEKNLKDSLEYLYSKMCRVYQKNLKKKGLKGFKLEQVECREKKLELEAFHQVHTQKVFMSGWKGVIDLLKLENMEEQRPLIKKANEYHKISLLLRCLRCLKENAVESKKEKNINEQKEKIKSKIKGIISEKIEINFDDFL